MDNLKQTLFEHTYHRLKQYQHDVKEFGELSAATVSAETMFSALYSVIEAAGLEDEYLAWREAMLEELKSVFQVMMHRQCISPAMK